MSIQVSILLKRMEWTSDDSEAVLVEEAVDYIPGETLEQLISRVLYRHPGYQRVLGVGPGMFDFEPVWGASRQVLEVRLVREVL